MNSFLTKLTKPANISVHVFVYYIGEKADIFVTQKTYFLLNTGDKTFSVLLRQHTTHLQLPFFGKSAAFLNVTQFVSHKQVPVHNVSFLGKIQITLDKFV